MNSKQMDYLIELSKTLNFNRAAENLFISQPALSYQIKVIEEEVGFAIFERVGKSVHLTPAGQQFCQQITHIKQELQSAIEQGQNFSSRYSQNLTIGYSLRSHLHFLPEVIREFRELHPDVLITPRIALEDWFSRFREGSVDMIFTTKEEAQKLPNARIHPLYTSSIYLLVNPDDTLAQLQKANARDLDGRTLLVNGGSSQTLRRVQKQVLDQVPLQTLNSPTHDFTMVSVASGQAICLSPGYLKDFSSAFVWVPFDTQEHFDCVLVTHENDKRQSLADFVLLMQDIYEEKAKKHQL
ncbi:LysR family transcriptional regulator [Streptococcus hyointestinalis]|uniref:LysR family transcriptional regulator n=1 Tax=Streptococcus hyointestinalis TaxID=1337 RepID=A0A380KAW8_9STRE|nr:LysR family transcriptional regulator [Streptococcus hyointestinalis]MCI6870931.1 LysR family transcriptional regulator [Streptococcus hyointestinalis]MDD7356390.1 LysR family transcriptional regulator [Streptococcus hyointestinalis]MDY4553812.1 LysR family transcriptional regulator [Streptococcus hyointestinalis]SUN62081.1 LysR family transcriptional regulator [Streptococcus hyointestinalis]